MQPTAEEMSFFASVGSSHSSQQKITTRQRSGFNQSHCSSCSTMSNCRCRTK